MFVENRASKNKSGFFAFLVLFQYNKDTIYKNNSYYLTKQYYEIAY